LFFFVQSPFIAGLVPGFSDLVYRFDSTLVLDPRSVVLVVLKVFGVLHQPWMWVWGMGQSVLFETLLGLLTVYFSRLNLFEVIVDFRFEFPGRLIEVSVNDCGGRRSNGKRASSSLI